MQDTKKPNFFLLGAPKAGTTSLFHYLTQHPDVFGSTPKETRFFVRDDLYNKGIDFYLKSFFRNSHNAKRVGEGTPAYLGHPKVASRIRNDIGMHPKFLVILRNPVDRAWANYLHRKNKATEHKEFMEVIREDMDGLLNHKPIFHRYYSGGLYSNQLKEWFSIFDQKNFLILFFEDLKKEPQNMLKTIFDFLELKNDVEINTSQKKNQSFAPRNKKISMFAASPPKFISFLFNKSVPEKYKSHIRLKIMNSLTKPLKNKEEMKLEDKEKLYELYKPEIIKLENLIGVDLNHWKI